jgi:anti-sigma B factor antagonist
MSIRFDDLGDVTIFRLSERILDERTTSSEIEQIDRLTTERGCRKIVLDFKNVEYFSSAAMGKLINLHKKLQAVKGQLSLCNVIPQVFEVFTITKLDKIFPIADEPKQDESDDDPDADLGGVGARLKPPKPSGGGHVILPLPPPEPD